MNLAGAAFIHIGQMAKNEHEHAEHHEKDERKKCEPVQHVTGILAGAVGISDKFLIADGQNGPHIRAQGFQFGPDLGDGGEQGGVVSIYPWHHCLDRAVRIFKSSVNAF